MDTLTHLVEQYYDRSLLKEWRRLDNHRTEFALTMRAVRQHLPPPPRNLIDIGGGPGRYAIALTQLGYQVTLVDISARCLDFAAERAAEVGVTLHATRRANALHLAGMADAAYDGALLLGPLYHLLRRDERARAVREAMRVLRPGGRLFAAFITRFAPFRYAVREEPGWILRDLEYARRVLETGIHDRGQELPQVYFAHPEEVRPFMEACNLRTLLLVGLEGVASGQEEAINQLEGEDWQAWVDLNYHLGQEPSLFGASEHLLYVGEKPGD
jgi:ubiquinone/menaquinone biosynthesis C-methylase UbiE